jgi:hypothetical protein
VFSLPVCSGLVVHRGVGCEDSGGTALVLGGTGCPDLGSTLFLEALATPSPIPMLFAGGTSDMFFGGAPLPLDLGLIGGPAGCLLYTSSEAVLSAPMVGGSATLPFAIPNNPGLAGAQIFMQAVELDPGLAVALPLATSNYVSITVN